MIELQWKPFHVNLDKVSIALRALIGANYDGLVCDEVSLRVMFLNEVSPEEAAEVVDYWDNLTEQDLAPTIQEILTSRVNDAMQFGTKLINDAAIENVIMGITQAGLTAEVSDYLHKLSHYLSTGALYAALGEIARLKSEGRTDLEPFVSVARLEAYEQLIAEYLEL